ncbi:MAG: hypothetical protein BroJett013_30320 [Alphaproteobacteria bacterium]|nr:MAG: hypothetical protein BroJett013_30320 [Alphaproteobacteria bacterium]
MSGRAASVRGAFAPTPAALDQARAALAMAAAAVRVNWSGSELAQTGVVERKNLGASVARLERALVVYVANVSLNTPKRVLAAALDIDPKQVRRWVRFVEAWRDAGAIDWLLTQIEAALPRSTS